MRLVRYRKGAGSPVTWGWLSEDKIGLVNGSPYAEYRRREARLPIDSVELLPPVTPGKIICVGRNYASHAAEHEVDVPELPLLFLKPPSAVIGDGDFIYLPPQSSQIEHEGELAVVIGQRCRWVEPRSAMEMVLGYAIANDVTARDLQRLDGQWTRGKGFDTFCPIGPWIETEFEPADALITCTVNGQMRQMASTRDMIFPVRQIVAFASSVMTLEPGDVILTGTPSGVGPLTDGDDVAIEIEGIGILSNRVRSDPTAPASAQG
jgi:2-keto-4-pentenoate hydratase/2-oxohepta-3-ene-1,7-dioic acid hydratase in catechol pathway